VVPRYSTDIAAAWQVVEWSIERGYDIDVAIDNDGAEVVFIPDRCPGETWLERAPTAPEAICLAFLAAMEAK
jgi:hypothetical protein